LKYLGLIDAMRFFAQHQREVKSGVVEGRRVDYVEATLSRHRHREPSGVGGLGRTLDELPPQTRRLLFSVEEMVAGIAEEKGIERKHVRFTRRDVREYSGWGNTQLKIHLHRLEEMEYVLVLRGGRGQQMVYELAYDGEGKAGERFVLGLVDVEKLRTGKVNGYDVNRSGSGGQWSGQKKNRSGSSRPQVGGVSGAGRDSSSDDTNQDRAEIEVIPPKTPHLEVEKVRPVVAQAASYRQAAGRD
jgi:DNA primase